MKKLTLYKYTTGGLLLLNIAIIAFFVLMKPPHPRHGKKGQFRNEAIRILQLDKNQADIFKKSAHKHHKMMVSIGNQQKALLLPYFKTIIDTTGKSQIIYDALDQNLRLENKKVEKTYSHFEEIKGILNTNQQANFEVFMTEALDRVLLKNKKNR